MHDDILLADGFNDALIGVTSKNIAVYDIDKCFKVLIKQGMSEEDAIDYFYFNVEGAYVGEQTPIYMHTDESKDMILDVNEKANLRIYKGEA